MEFIRRPSEFIMHMCHDNCRMIPNVRLERIQAQRRVAYKRRLRNLGVYIPEGAMFNLQFLQLLLSKAKGTL